MRKPFKKRDVLRRRRRLGGGTAPYSVTLTNLTGGVAIVGDIIGYSTDAGVVDAQRWFVDGIQVSVATTYTIQAADDGKTLRLEVDSGADTVAATAGIAYDAPVATGGLVNQSFTENTGVQTYDTSGDFTGSDITYSVNTVTGVTINSGTGVVSFDTDVMALQTGTAITVTATNSGGSDTSSFNVAIEVASAVSALLLEDGFTLLLESGDRLLLEA